MSLDHEKVKLMKNIDFDFDFGFDDVLILPVPGLDTLLALVLVLDPVLSQVHAVVVVAVVVVDESTFVVGQMLVVDF